MYITERERKAELESFALEEAELLKSLAKLVAIVEFYHSEEGGCDHSVGICLCGEIADLEEAKELLARMKGA
jgi:hypothetical protein